ncbi:Hypothetical protein D9617_3g021450 [Elsinoe fawcettii]|nr:Hypothetical protein D9617_3g021450 [Elsinoe fawcettii]
MPNHAAAATNWEWKEWLGDLKSHFNAELFSDVTLAFSGRHIYAHRVILAARSRYFVTLFAGPFEESQQRIIELEEDNAEALETMLRIMYDRGAMITLQRGTNDNIQDLQELFTVSDKYQVDSINRVALEELLKVFSGKWHADNVRQVLEFLVSLSADTMVECEDMVVDAIYQGHYLAIINLDEFDVLIEHHPIIFPRIKRGGLFKTSQLSDVTFVAGGIRLHAHKFILASKSEYFKIMFCHDFRESDQGLITLEEDDPRGLKYMFTYFYNIDALKDISVSDGDFAEKTSAIFVVADKYCVYGLPERAMDLLLQDLTENWEKKRVTSVLPALSGLTQS